MYVFVNKACYQVIHASTHDFMVNVLKSAASCTTKGENICNHQIKNCNFNLEINFGFLTLD